ncbi:jg21607 [Pararge aegeria aegeria]|uniref:Jg21607 protein n=1 Tax=Pararge aegeria aegeria TaxID=348720 RepID=A0A8S4R552_9NEOP|nr:jg21607 [Pararge aegeria aegeria]
MRVRLLRSSAFLEHWSMEVCVAAFIMSVQRVGDRPRDRLPSTFNWTTIYSMECLFLVMCPKNLRIRICTDDNLSLTFSSSRIDTLVRKAVQGIRNSRRQHHISSASILRRSFKRTVHVSAPYRNVGKTKLLIRRASG